MATELLSEFKIASAIENYVTSHEGVTDFPASLSQISDEVDTLRMRLIMEADRQGAFMRPFSGYTQRFTLDLDGSEPYTCPKIYTLSNGKPAVAYAGGSDRKSPFRIINGEGIYTSSYDIVTGDFPTVWFGESEIRLLNDEGPNTITIVAVLEDPSQASPYGYNEEESFYPVPLGMVDLIIGKTAESYLRHMYRIFPQPNTQSDIPIQPNAKGR